MIHKVAFSSLFDQGDMIHKVEFSPLFDQGDMIHRVDGLLLLFN